MATSQPAHIWVVPARAIAFRGTCARCAVSARFDHTLGRRVLYTARPPHVPRSARRWAALSGSAQTGPQIARLVRHQLGSARLRLGDQPNVLGINPEMADLLDAHRCHLAPFGLRIVGLDRIPVGHVWLGLWRADT